MLRSKRFTQTRGQLLARDVLNLTPNGPLSQRTRNNHNPALHQAKTSFCSPSIYPLPLVLLHHRPRQRSTHAHHSSEAETHELINFC